VNDLAEMPKQELQGDLKVREAIVNMENLWQDGEHVKGDAWVDVVDGGLEHQFINGLYVRMVRLPAGMTFTTKIHKKKHPFFLMSGRCRVITDKGFEIMEGPMMGVTEPGTKRLMYIEEEVVWYTVHRTDKTNPQDVEDEVIAKDFTEIETKENN
tara:strand:- start:20 stop:484 length:465 start_codon:yes stop_codon:yes gene_type:complete